MIEKRIFGFLPSGREIYSYTLSNDSITSFTVLTYGGILRSIYVKDKNGKADDVIMGFDNLWPYQTSGGCQGALIGRVANRIGGGKFTLDGVEYKLYQNDGNNTLHGGKSGFNQKIWNAEETDGEEPSVALTYTSPDGEENFPGTLETKVTYSLTKDGGVKIHYEATTDKPTVVSMTNHSYFNLSGVSSGVIDCNILQIDADRINSVDHDLIPDGKFIDVEGTVYDFRNGRRIGDGFDSDCWMMKEFLGYDNNFVFTYYDGTIKKRATLSDPKSGRHLDLYTDAPCVQIYTANMIDPEDPPFKGGIKQYKHCATCLETQAMPDAMNHEGFTDIVLRPGEKYDTTTIFAFGN